MQTTPENLLRALVAHLGITYRLSIHQDRHGTPVREHHLYAEPEMISQALRWQLRYDGPDTIRVFEGDPPPF